ncbi:MAG: IS1 family transposase [Leptolyngbyaceae cyanobacterium RM2_2_4]|nr:IS1 family transposase [Leptolyngbyaceae cyanobacterium RM2_2_4]
MRRSRYEELKALLVVYLVPHVEAKATDEEVMKVMECPHCHSSRLSKNRHRHSKQRYLCKDCDKQFLERTD